MAKLVVEKACYRACFNLEESKATFGLSSVEAACEGGGEMHSSPIEGAQAEILPSVDWDTPIIMSGDDADVETHVMFEDAKLDEAMGFKATDDIVEQEEKPRHLHLFMCVQQTFNKT